MRLWRITCLCSVIALLMPAQEGRRPRSYATLEIAFPAHESGFWGRFKVTGDPPGFSGWIVPKPQMSYYQVDRLPVSPATRFKAILYSPGCALRVSDIPINAVQEFKYVFDCDAVSSTSIRGRVKRFDRFYGHRVRIEAKYVALCAPAFMESTTAQRQRSHWAVQRLWVMTAPSGCPFRTFPATSWLQPRTTLAKFNFGPETKSAVALWRS